MYAGSRRLSRVEFLWWPSAHFTDCNYTANGIISEGRNSCLSTVNAWPVEGRGVPHARTSTAVPAFMARRPDDADAGGLEQAA